MTLVGDPKNNPGVGGAGALNPPQTLEKYISVELAGNAYCVEAQAVDEVVTPLGVTRLPDGPEWLRGLAAHRGDIVAVIDPRTIDANAAPDPTEAKAKLIIFRSLQDGTKFGLPVDAVRELFTAVSSDFSEAIGSSPFQHSELAREIGPVKLIDHAAMFESFYEYQAVS